MASEAAEHVCEPSAQVEPVQLGGDDQRLQSGQPPACPPPVRDNQITLGKNFDGFTPIGPCIVCADAMPRPDRVRLRSILNGRTMQDGTTENWLFPLPRLLSVLSHVMALEPGDVVTTATPAGVCLFQSPPVFMRPGDTIRIEADGIGALTSHTVEPP